MNIRFIEANIMRTKDEALHRRRKSEIMNAAAQCFAAKGIHQTNMQEICDTAKISAGALYRYYDSKDAIILALAESERAANAELIAHLVGSKDIVEGICQALPEILDVLCGEQYGRLAIEIGAEATRNPSIAAVFGKNETELLSAFVETLRLGQQRGTVNPELDAEGAAFTILAMLDGVVGRSMLKNSPSRKQITRSMEHFIRQSLRAE